MWGDARGHGGAEQWGADIAPSMMAVWDRPRPHSGSKRPFRLAGRPDPGVGWLGHGSGPSGCSPLHPHVYHRSALSGMAWDVYSLIAFLSSRVSGWPHQPVVHEHLIPHLPTDKRGLAMGCITSAIPLVRPLPQLLVGISSSPQLAGDFLYQRASRADQCWHYPVHHAEEPDRQARPFDAVASAP